MMSSPHFMATFGLCSCSESNTCLEVKYIDLWSFGVLDVYCLMFFGPSVLWETIYIDKINTYSDVYWVLWKQSTWIEGEGCSVLRHFQQYFSYIVAVIFVGAGNRSTRNKTHRPVASHWQTLSHNVVSSTPRHERDVKHHKPIIPDLNKFIRSYVFLRVISLITAKYYQVWQERWKRTTNLIVIYS